MPSTLQVYWALLSPVLLAACATEMVDGVVPSIQEKSGWYQIASGHIQYGGWISYTISLYPFTLLDTGLPNSPLTIYLHTNIRSDDRFELDPSQIMLQVGERTYQARGETCSPGSSSNTKAISHPRVLAKTDCVKLLFDAPGPKDWKHTSLTLFGLRRNGDILAVPTINLDLKKVPPYGSFI